MWSLDPMNIRDFATDKHKSVDDTPAGGGPGMVLRADILGSAIDKAIDKAEEKVQESVPLIYLSPRGQRFDQAKAKELAEKKGATFICGRFEGIDERILKARNIEEISMGDFVLSGGEMAAFTILDSVVRLLPGVIGDPETLLEESFESGLLEYPHYTRPQIWEGLHIPDVLNSGNHKKIKDWRLKKAEDLTQTRRPDMWEEYLADKDDKNESPKS